MTTELTHYSIGYPAERIPARTLNEKQQSIQQQLLSIYMYLLNLGTHTVKDARQTKYIQLSNFVAMTSLLASMVYIALSILWANPLWFIIVNTLCITSVFVLLLNSMGMVRLSRVLYLTAINPILFVAALVTGPASRGEHFLIIAVLVPFLIYDLKHIRMIMLGIAAPIMLILVYEYVQPYFVPYALSVAHQYTLRILGIFMEAGLIIAAVSQFIYYTRRTETQLGEANEQLTLQTTELQRSNADLEQFAYVISHDLKTPVRNISCFMKLLANKHAAVFNTEAREFVDYAMTGAKRMERLIDDVLAYSRIGRNLAPSAPVNLNDLISTISYEQQDKLTASNGAITVVKELPVLTGVHSSLMYYVFQNLIINGLKFNTSARPEIIIACDSTSEQYIFSVSDNGIGIAKEYGSQVYKMFKRLHNDNEYEGTGIGLAICKKIIDQYGGDIWFESQGTGTTFYFTIRK
jgi:signal transduction histidine kinase